MFIHSKLNIKSLLDDMLFVSYSYHIFILLDNRCSEEAHRAAYSSPWCPLDTKLPAANQRTFKIKVKRFIWETQRAASGSELAKNLMRPSKGGEKVSQLSERGQKSASHWKNGGAAVSNGAVRGFSDQALGLSVSLSGAKWPRQACAWTKDKVE